MIDFDINIPAGLNVYDLSTKVYRAPTAGWYRIPSEVITSSPTGRILTTPNPDWHWWAFWRPVFIRTPEYQTTKAFTRTTVRRFKRGDTIPLGAELIS